jgi:RNA polymerase sigma factor (sigma-70 family)
MPAYSKEDEKVIINKIINGDSEQFHWILNHYKKLVYHIVFRLIYNHHDHEDICQDIFLKVFENLPKFEQKAKLSTWIAKIAYNTCINYIQKKREIVLNSQTFEPDIWDNLLQNNFTPSIETEKKDSFSRIQAEINKLKPIAQAILTLYHLDEMSYREIGEVLTLPEGTVKSYLFRARKHLKERLIKKYQVEEL